LSRPCSIEALKSSGAWNYLNLIVPACHEEALMRDCTETTGKLIAPPCPGGALRRAVLINFHDFSIGYE